MPTTLTAAAVRAALREHATESRAEAYRRFFKTGKGEYGEHDVFIGVTVPDQRKLARDFRGLPPKAINALLSSKVHEERLTALLILVDAFKRAKRDPSTRDLLAQLYLDRLDAVNNWDLVDSSAPHILGAWLHDRDRAMLDGLARSDRLWTRRVAMLATQFFIRQGEADDGLRIAAILVDDAEDLIHKAVGWMLREIGEYVGLAPMRGFLREHAATMPRTMLRYTIEKLSPAERARWLGARD